MNNEEFDKMMEQIVDKLGDHCDSLRIFMSRYDPDAKDTEGYTIGAGNFDAQMGQIAAWLQRQNQLIREKAKMDIHSEDDL